MKQLTPVDTAFLSMETSTQYGHVSSIIILDPSAVAGGGDVCDGDLYGALRRAFEERLHLLPVYRRKLATVPLGLDHPYWVDDPDLDLEFHLRELALPAPGNDRQLAEQISRIVARPLDRSRPLWEWYVISGLDNGNVAVLAKLHHSTIDGASGVEMIQVLLDAEPEGRTIEPPGHPWQPERTPSQLELLVRSLLGLATRPQKAAGVQVQLLRTAAKLTGNPAIRQMAAAAMPGLRRLRRFAGEPAEGTVRPTLPIRPAPRTPFNRAITPHRRFAFRTLALSDAQTIKRAFGVTVNDVVMALCASALRRYLDDRNALPNDPLIAMVPVSIRTAKDAGTYENRVTGVVSSLHTHLSDPVERLAAIHRSMAAAKELQTAIPATILTDITQFTPPALAAQAARLASRTRIADRMNPPFNLIISNVPGPRQPLYLSGAVMKHFYPVSTVADGMGLNMTVQSYLDNLDFGFIGCRELVPDLWDLCDHLADGMDELLKAAAGV